MRQDTESQKFERNNTGRRELLTITLHNLWDQNSIFRVGCSKTTGHTNVAHPLLPALELGLGHDRPATAVSPTRGPALSLPSPPDCLDPGPAKQAIPSYAFWRPRRLFHLGGLSGNASSQKTINKVSVYLRKRTLTSPYLHTNSLTAYTRWKLC